MSDPKAVLAGLANAQRIATDVAASGLFVDAINATVNDTLETVATALSEPGLVLADLPTLVRGWKIDRRPTT